MFQRLGPLEIGLILVVILIIFGVGRLPQVGEAIGKGIRGFKKSLHEEEKTENTAKTETKNEPAPKV
ncbi:MAG: preprotein translocase subunit TatA [Chloroflexi bacterium RBG_16_48_7]|nr:MAG: preprotein translocase subunit TatA [Chloroflexi bacterium RBG_16_48_7]